MITANHEYDIGFSQDAAVNNVAVQGSMTGRDKNAIARQLRNTSAATSLHVAYVSAGKSTFTGERAGDTAATDDDWKFAFTRIAAGGQAIVDCTRPFNIGEDIKTSYTSGTGVLAWTSTSGLYYIIKIITPTAQTATLVKCTYVKKSSKTSTTVLSLVPGENTFLVLANDTATTLTLGTADAAALTAVYLNTAWTLGLCQEDF